MSAGEFLLSMSSWLRTSSAYCFPACNAQHQTTLGQPFHNALDCSQSNRVCPVFHCIHCHPLQPLTMPGITNQQNNSYHVCHHAAFDGHAFPHDLPLNAIKPTHWHLMIYGSMQSYSYCVLWLITSLTHFPTMLLSSCTDSLVQNITFVASCTYVAKANGWCITTAKPAHKLQDACIPNYLSKLKDSNQANLVDFDVFTQFFFISPTKKQCLILLPVTEATATGGDTIIGTWSTDASISNLMHIDAKAVGNIFAMLPAEEPCRSLPVGKTFVHANIPDLATYFQTVCAKNNQFMFIKLPTVFPNSYGTPSIQWDLPETGLVLCYATSAIQLDPSGLSLLPIGPRH